MVKRIAVLVLVSLLAASGGGCSDLLPPLLGPFGGSGGGGSKSIERIHGKALASTQTAKTDKQLEVVDGLTRSAMDKVSLPEVYPPQYQPSLAEKIAYTTQFAGKAIEKAAPVFPLAPVVGGGVTLLGSLVATGLGWGRLMRTRKTLAALGRDRQEMEKTAGTLIEGIENFSNENTDAGKLLKELIKNRSIASGTSTTLHSLIKERV